MAQMSFSLNLDHTLLEKLLRKSQVESNQRYGTCLDAEEDYKFFIVSQLMDKCIGSFSIQLSANDIVGANSVSPERPNLSFDGTLDEEHYLSENETNCAQDHAQSCSTSQHLQSPSFTLMPTRCDATKQDESCMSLYEDEQDDAISAIAQSAEASFTGELMDAMSSVEAEGITAVPTQCAIPRYSFAQDSANNKSFLVNQSSCPVQNKPANHRRLYKRVCGRIGKASCRVTNGVKSWDCEECNFKTSWYSSMLVHKKSVHSNERPYPCALCNYTCKLKGNLKKHYIGSHKLETESATRLLVNTQRAVANQSYDKTFNQSNYTVEQPNHDAEYTHEVVDDFVLDLMSKKANPPPAANEGSATSSEPPSNSSGDSILVLSPTVSNDFVT